MPAKKKDKRAIKTQRQIKEALAELLTKKELRNITVQEISDKADVHRVTFYKHYYDIFDLYDKMEQELLSDFGLMILKFQNDYSEEVGKEFIEYIKENKIFFKMVFSPYNTGELLQKMTKIIEGSFRIFQSEQNEVKFHSDRLEYLSTCWANICVAILGKWVNSDFEQSNDSISKLVVEFEEVMNQLIAKENN
ncbi:MAG: TetR family transcriptional regulator C-terminal domain-containing protein [Lachnospiraceae bacterium]|nr:TetR family transcriptional regulator C-terminal domain-containing protein [Lachnospiraceae bacterium]